MPSSAATALPAPRRVYNITRRCTCAHKPFCILISALALNRAALHLDLVRARARGWAGAVGGTFYQPVTHTCARFLADRRKQAPEVLNGERYGKAADVYSTGMVAWALLSGTLPFADLANPMAVMLKIVQGQRPPLDPSWPPLFCEQLLPRLWGADPALRPPMEELRLALEDNLHRPTTTGTIASSALASVP